MHQLAMIDNTLWMLELVKLGAFYLRTRLMAICLALVSKKVNIVGEKSTSGVARSKAGRVLLPLSAF